MSPLSREQLEGSLFNSYYTEVWGEGALLLSLDFSTLLLIHTLYCWVLSKLVSSTILKIFGMTQPGIEHGSPGPLTNTLLTWRMKDNVVATSCLLPFVDTSFHIKISIQWAYTQTNTILPQLQDNVHYQLVIQSRLFNE